MKTLKQKISEYKTKVANDSTLEPTVRLCVGVALTNVVNMIGNEEDGLEDLIYENEENEFLKKIYLRFSLALLGFIGILIFLLCQK